MNLTDINIPPDNYADMTPAQKEALLGYILLEKLYREDEVMDWLKDLLTNEQDDALLSRIIEMLGGCLADAEFRNKLAVISGKYSENSLTYNAVRELMITALFVNSEDVKSWGAAQLKDKENIDAKNETKLVDYLKNLLNDFNLPLRLRWHTGLALANIGTPNAIDALIDFAQHLSKRLPQNETDNYYDNQNLFLAEKIAYCIGFAADKMLLPQLDKASEILMELHNMIEESPQIEWATERINNVGISPCAYPVTDQLQGNHRGLPLQKITDGCLKIAIPDIVEGVIKWIADLWIPEGAGQLLSAADNSRQEKYFFNGTVKIACISEEESGSTPAYIWLSWDALKTPENSELIIRLENPETKELLFKLCLGDIKEGEQAFVSRELGFDPTKTPWAINVGLREIRK